MPVQFVVGRAGSGKTRHLLQLIDEQNKADPFGPPIYWLLPKQATFEAERLLTARLGAFTRVHVVSFDQLGKEILLHCGDVGMPEVTAIGRRMVIGHLLRCHQKQLKYYTASAHRAGLAAELDSIFGEFERAGLDSAGFDILLNNLQGDERTTPGLLDKLADLHLLMNQYNSYIGQEKLDPQRRLALILKRVASCSPIKTACLLVDDFFDFTAHERRFLTSLAGTVTQTVISLLIDPASNAIANPGAILNDLSIFNRTERTYQSLHRSLKDAAITIAEPIILQTNHRVAATDMAAFERQLFLSPPEGLQLKLVEALDAPDARSEVDAIARRIQAAVAEGLRYRDIGLLVRHLGDYQEIIDASFREHHLPYFADHRRAAGHHPLLQMVRACLQIARHHWPHEAVMSLLKTGLAGVTDDQADELENYVLQHRIRGRKWESDEPWAFQRDLVREEDEYGLPLLSDSERIDVLRRKLHESLMPLLELAQPPKHRTVREITTRIFTVLESFDVRTRLSEWMIQAEQTGNLERRDEHEQVWSEFVQLSEHLVDLLGNESVTLTDFIDVLDSGLESFDLALTPPKVDQILVGQIDRTRPPELKLVFVLGLNEGTFPNVSNEHCVISDRERKTLRQRNVDLDTDSDRRLLDERFLAYFAFTRPSQRLVLSRPVADAKGRPTNPSSFWVDILQMMPTLSLEHVSRLSRSDVTSIATPRQLVTSLMRWVRSGAALEAEDPRPALYQWLATADVGDGVATMRDRAWRALSYSNTAQLRPDLARQLFPSPLQASVAQLETLAACPFRHFARHGLKLFTRDDTEVTAIDLSNAYHDILENLVAGILQSRQDWCELHPDKCQEFIKTHAADIGRRLRGELMLSNSRNQYLLERIERTLEQAVLAMTEMHRRGNYRPAYASLRFGKGGTLPAHRITTPAGEVVELHGRIDRVDLNDRRSGFVVADYKLSAGALALDRVYHGLSLQLLTYLLVVQSNGQQLAGRKITPAAAFLLQLLRSPQTVDHPAGAIAIDDPDYHLRIKPRGLIETRAVKSLDADLVEGHSKVIGVYVKRDGQLGNRHVTDVADEADFKALLEHVEKRLGELADQAATGDISVTPYMIARQTPCSRCEYRSVCRFEPGINHYRMLSTMKREEVLRTVSGRPPVDSK